MKRLLYLLVLSAAAASAQTAVWPGAVVTDSQLLVAANFCGSRLSADVTDTVSTTIFVTNASVSPTCFLVNQEVQVDNEMMKITSVGFGQLTVVRGFDNSTASTHHNNAPINNVPAAWYHNAVAKEIESIETWLAAGGGGGGGGGTPGGLNGSIQYNNNGAFGGYPIVPTANLPPATTSALGTVQLPSGATSTTLGTSAIPSTIYYVTPNGPYTTIQQAMDAASAAGGTTSQCFPYTPGMSLPSGCIFGGGGGTIILPDGVINISSTLYFNLGHAGITLQGQGIPYACYPLNTAGGGVANPTCTSGTVLRWTGAANGTMFDLNSVYHVIIRDMKLDGGSSYTNPTITAGNAGILIEYEANGCPGGGCGGTNSQNDLINLELQYAQGTPGEGIEVCRSSTFNCSEIRIKNVYIHGCVTDYYQDGGQTFIWAEHFYPLAATQTGIQIQNGFFSLDHGEFSGEGTQSILLGGYQGGYIRLNDMDWEDPTPWLTVSDSTNTANLPLVYVTNMRGLYTPNATPGNMINWGIGSIGVPANYVSGGTLTGTGTCLISAANGGGSGGQLTMTVTGGAFTSFAIASAGSGYTSEPTSWSYVSGAACSTTVTTSGGSSGGAGGVLSIRDSKVATLFPSSALTINLIQGGGGASLVYYDQNNLFLSTPSVVSVNYYSGTILPVVLNNGSITLNTLTGKAPTGTTSTQWLKANNTSGTTLGGCDYTLLCSGAAFLSPNTSPTAAISNGALFLGSLKVMGWSSTTAWNGGVDTAWSRQAAHILAAGNGTAGDSSSGLKAAAYMSVGTKYTTNAGCSETGLTGGATAGYLHSGTSGTCTFVITMGNSMTAPNGWHCSMTNFTTPADVVRQTNLTTTTATMSGTTVTNDLLVFSCAGF